WTTLHSWISTTWLAGTCVAVTVTVPPGATLFGFTASVVEASADWHSPSRSRGASTAGIPITRRRRTRRKRLAGGAGPEPKGDGLATATVAGWAGAATRSATAALAIGTVEARAGAITIVLATRGGGVAGEWSAAASASTNAEDDSHRVAGSLASPRLITSSTCGPSEGLRELGAGGSRWTWA